MEIINENGSPVMPAGSSVYNTKIEFKGDGWELLGIYIINWILTTITIGLYYPWAKIKRLRYVFSQTEFAGTRFEFHGTGREVFIGYIKVWALIVGLYAVLMYGALSQNFAVLFTAIMLFYVAFFLLIPFAIHGMMRYRTSCTTWRGIHWGYRGNRGTLIGKFILGVILTAITLSIYSSWFTTDMRKYIIGNIRFGSIRFEYTGKGFPLFLINLKGIIFTILTLGIYIFWYQRNYHNFYVNHIRAVQGEKVIPFKAATTAGGYFELLVINLLIVIFTLGIGYPFTVVRSLKFFFENLQIDPSFNPEDILQTEEDYKNALGEDIGDVLDIGIV